MLGLYILTGLLVLLLLGGVACAISNWRNGVDVGSDR